MKDCFSKIVMAVALLGLFASSASAQIGYRVRSFVQGGCANGQCGQSVRSCANGQCGQAVQYSQPMQYSQPVVRYSQPVQYSQPRVVQRIEPVPQLVSPRRMVSTPQVFDTASFHSNGSGETLSYHLQHKHGINAAGMSVQQQEALHRQAHGW